MSISFGPAGDKRKRIQPSNGTFPIYLQEQYQDEQREHATNIVALERHTGRLEERIRRPAKDLFIERVTDFVNYVRAEFTPGDAFVSYTARCLHNYCRREEEEHPYLPNPNLGFIILTCRIDAAGIITLTSTMTFYQVVNAERDECVRAIAQNLENEGVLFSQLGEFSYENFVQG